ncbi:MAG TPA: LapA family protein [Anaerolineales bacterium]
MIVTLVVVLVLAILSVIFALQNATVIKAAFFGLQMQGPLAVFVLAGVGIGMIIGVLMMTPNAVRNAIVLSRQRKQIDGLEKSLKEEQARVVEAKPPISEMPAPVSPVVTAPPAELPAPEPLKPEE